MKILLTSAQIIKRRPVWTHNALTKFVESDHVQKSKVGDKNVPLYDMAKVIAAEQTENFKQWRTQYEAKKRSQS
ncbi:hypothetical protein Cva_00798 [Caedimonas varicaedens]|uniref:Uncharacterized protein n=1 Tax=Caedimonas varicaedens TaxID=1629334 RepID=A0A0K8MC75_9PROT|nr:hypothetical protein Cva_00798 [Caedimonas varicaedens]